MKKRYIVTITKELEELWGLDDLAEDYTDSEIEAFKAAAIDLLHEDVQAVVEGATWTIEAEAA